MWKHRQTPDLQPPLSPSFTADHSPLLLCFFFFGLFHYANEVMAKVIIHHWSLQSLPSQTLLRQLAHSKNHGCPVGGMGEEGGFQRLKGMSRKKRSTDAMNHVCEELKNQPNLIHEIPYNMKYIYWHEHLLFNQCFSRCHSNLEFEYTDCTFQAPVGIFTVS